jgi:hypothetical protein
MAALTFTPLRISTLVTTGHLGSTINLTKLFEQVPALLIPIGYPAEGILKMEHETKVVGHSARDMLTKRRVSVKTFFNQSTLVIRKLRGGEGGDATDFKEVNMKLFANGGFQMTGVTSEEFSQIVLQFVLQKFAALPEPISTEPLTVKKFAIQLLNSDYKMSALLKRAELHRILCHQYRLSSTLETTIYQGVNTKYITTRQLRQHGAFVCVRGSVTAREMARRWGSVRRLRSQRFRRGVLSLRARGIGGSWTRPTGS